jgi:hypothetical protein
MFKSIGNWPPGVLQMHYFDLPMIEYVIYLPGVFEADGIEHSSTSQSQNTRKDGRVDRNILERSRFRGDGRSIFEIKDTELVLYSLVIWVLTHSDPNLQPPSKPTKRQITEADRRKEEEELQMALELSVKDRQPSVSQSTPQTSQSASNTAPVQTQAQTSQPIAQGTTAATVSRVRALFDFQPSEPGELQFKKGDIIAVLESVYKDWWKGSLRGQVGIFPLNYVEKLSDPTPEELEREAHMESEVFGEIKNVEKLLTLLSTSSSDLNIRDNEEITTLYHRTLAIRPKLIELIGKYSQKKGMVGLKSLQYLTTYR